MDKQKVVIAYDSNIIESSTEFAKVKYRLANHFYDNNVNIISKDKITWELDEIRIYFYDISKRNLNNFIEKHGKAGPNISDFFVKS